VVQLPNNMENFSTMLEIVLCMFINMLVLKKIDWQYSIEQEAALDSVYAWFLANREFFHGK
jgi:hypothetical protein